MKISILTKTIIIFTSFVIIVALAAVLVNNIFLGELIRDKYSETALALTNSIALTVDTNKISKLVNEVKEIYNNTENKVDSSDWGSDEFYEYLANYSHIEEDPDFIEIRDYLRTLSEKTEVDCLYFSIIDVENKKFIYVLDSAEEDPCPPGCIDPLYEINYGLLEDPEIGFPPYITNTEEYGWLLTGGVAVHDEDGNVIGYIVADISMNEIIKKKDAIVFQLIIVLMVTTAVIEAIIILFFSKTLVRPIKKLSKAASTYYDDSSDFNEEKHVFSDIEIRTNDEVKNLYESMKKMEIDINTHINKLTKMNTELEESKDYGAKMSEMANTDALTGVGNKTSFNHHAEQLNQAIAEGKAEFGIVMFDLNNLKITNDTFGHKAGDEAIQSLANLVKQTFKDLPIFRVGGDEFFVIVENDELKNVDSFINDFKQKMNDQKKDTSLPEWKRITSACGYSIFNPAQDKSVDDVSKKADKEMYRNKTEIKKAK